jgi:23S rRNA pseudouridine2605 synthase
VSDAGERLQKALARAGVGSRRAVEDLIVAGRVRVNGARARLGQRITPRDVVEVDGSPVPLDADLVHLLCHKPAGVVSTAADPEGRPTVLDLVGQAERLWPVGRLDIGTEGAILVTNDGDLTHRLTHPRYSVPRTYLVEAGGSMGRAGVRALVRGVDLEDGRARAVAVSLRGRRPGATLLEVTITEGRNRQVRRMLEAVGHPVRRLVRTSIGPLSLGRLRPGTCRRLSPEEVRAVYRVCGL